MKEFLLLCAIVWSFLPPAVAAQQSKMHFGGFTIDITAEQLKRSFPHSVISVSDHSTYVRIANEDVKDGVTTGIIFMHKKKPHFIQLQFEIERAQNKPDSGFRNPFEQNPHCAPILAALTKRYGKPFGPFDNNEEGLVYKEYVWEQNQDKLILNCARHYQSKSKSQWAAAVRIGSSQPGSCMHSNCFEPPK